MYLQFDNGTNVIEFVRLLLEYFVRMLGGVLGRGGRATEVTVKSLI